MTVANTYLSTARHTYITPQMKSPSIPQDTSEDEEELKYPIDDRRSNFFLSEEENNSFQLGNPDFINKEVNYDEESNSYEIEERIGKEDYRDPTNMTFDEYVDKRSEQMERDYWQKRSRASSLLENENIMPELQVGNKVFDRIFGGSLIEITPTGNITLTFGGNYQKIDNPNLTEQQKTQGGFLFDMSINANVSGNIGDKMKIDFSYNTESQFDFNNEIKLDYSGDEDEIIQKIEAGNISFSPPTSLISGSQSLFGIKTELQFGRLTMTNVFSKQQSKKESIEIQGGAQEKEFEIPIDEYEANRHFYLAHFFRDNYNKALKDLPVINSNISIENIEVWVTNTSGKTENTRNVVAFMDMGESDPYRQSLETNSNSNLPRNEANALDSILNNDPSLRHSNTVTQRLQDKYGFQPVQDFEKTYAKKLSESEYTFHKKLGYISLNQTLNPDEVLAVAFEYTYNGKVYQVGELSQDIPTGNKGENVVFLKMLKSTSIRPRLPIWDLMMKNVYSLNAYQLSSNNFRLNVYYQDPGGGEKRYIPEGAPRGTPIIQLLNLDNLNQQNEAQRDGVFDYIRGVTINQKKGRIIFPIVEPFAGTNEPGSGLRSTFDNRRVADKYTFDQLYDSTKVVARQFPEFNRYVIKGTYQSKVSKQINLNRMNIPKGSVTVTAGGQKLEEGRDYRVDYQLGKVTILNEAILNSGKEIEISFESRDQFGVQKKTMWGSRLDYWINDNFSVGGTFMHLSERPLTRKVTFGNEPIANTMWGLDGNYHTESQFLTRLVDNIPLIDTKEKSSITAKGEFANMIPGNSDAIEQNDQSTTYLDDFEGTRSFYDLKGPTTDWQLASTPRGARNKLGKLLFPEADSIGKLVYNYNRAKLAWYMMDPLFARQIPSTPDHIKGNEDLQSNHFVREVKETEVFPERDVPEGGINVIPCLSLAYYPNERGTYNYNPNLNPDGSLKNPEEKWGGIMRDLINTDFETANVEFIEFWVMDPFVYKNEAEVDGGTFYIHLGNVSEDILRDGQKQFEHGLPEGQGEANVDTTAWGRLPVGQPITNSFSNNPEARQRQDVGLDGLNDEQESSFFEDYLDTLKGTVNDEVLQEIREDPSADDYHYYRGDDYNQRELHPLARYKKYNNPQGNSPTSQSSPESYSTSATNFPNEEDLNNDNTLSQSEEYYQYRVKITPEMLEPGKGYVTDKVTRKPTDYNQDSVTWYKMRIPIHNYDDKVGNISGFRSIRFIRMFMTGFEERTILRFARLGLVRHQWRKYQQPLLAPGEYQPSDFSKRTDFNVSVVNIEENSGRQPIPYVLPPDIQREQVQSNVSTSTVQQNEQSLAMDVCDLQDGDARAAYKNIDLDLRQFKEMKMYVHAEGKMNGPSLEDGDLKAFIRIGSDFKTNYYEYEIPLSPTTKTTYNYGDNPGKEVRETIWPEENYFNVPLDSLVQIKLKRNQAQVPLNQPYTTTNEEGRRITVVGNPDLGDAKVMMIGIRNPKASTSDDDDGLAKCGEVWFNELRLSDFNKDGGSAALAQVEAKLADFANIGISGNMHTIGFGSIDQSINERHQDNFYQYDLSGNFQLGKFFPKEWGVRLPLFLSLNESISNPKYDPYDSDVLYEDKLEFIRRNNEGAELERRLTKAKEKAQDYTRIKSLNFSNIRIAPPNASKKSQPWDLRNFNLTYAYTERFQRNPTTDTNLTRVNRGSMGYSYSPNFNGFQPLRSSIDPNLTYLQFLRDINFNPLPTSISVKTNAKRRFQKEKLRRIGSETIPIDPTFNKQFDWDRKYRLAWNLTKSISVNFQSSAISRVLEPPGALNTQRKKEQVWENVKEGGTMEKYQHNVNASYNLPFDKFPVTNWINANVSYNTNFSWNASARTERAENMGNRISNSQGKQINVNLNTRRLYRNLDKLYGQIGGLFPSPSDTAEQKKGNKKGKSKEESNLISKGIEQLITGIRNVSFTYRENRSTKLPGFTKTPSFLGADENLSAPGWDFLFGHQPWDRTFNNGQDWLEASADKGWISNDTLLNKKFVQSFDQQFNAKAGIEIFKGFRVDFRAKRNMSRTFDEYFRDTIGGPRDQFAHLNPMQSGNFNMSFHTWKTAFKSTDSAGRSEPYYNFEKYRSDYSKKLAREHRRNLKILNPDSIQAPGTYYEGYGPTSQQVLIPAFKAAYTGKKPQEVNTGNHFPDIPKPNWRLSFNGLQKLSILKNIFSNITITHAYNSTYQINRFSTALDYKADEKNNPVVKNKTTGNFYPEYRIEQVSINEQFSPLVEINMQFVNGVSARFSYSKSRNLTLSLTNYQLNENHSSQIRVGSGYKIGHLDLPFSLGPIGGGKLQRNSLDIKLDVTIRKTKQVIHKLDQNRTEPTGGNTSIAILPSADYKMSKSLTAQLFFNYRKNIPVTSRSYPQTSIRGGLKLRYSLRPG